MQLMTTNFTYDMAALVALIVTALTVQKNLCDLMTAILGDHVTAM